jgi:hypothetical protein
MAGSNSETAIASILPSTAWPTKGEKRCPIKTPDPFLAFPDPFLDRFLDPKRHREDQMKPVQTIGGSRIAVGAVLLVIELKELRAILESGYSPSEGLLWSFALGGIGSILALLTGIGLIARWLIRFNLAIVASLLFGLYVVAFLVLGDEGSMLIRVVVPPGLLLLCGITLRTPLRIRHSKLE